MFENVGATDLVVQNVEAERRLRLRFAVQLSLKVPDFIRCLQAHRQSPCPHQLEKHVGSAALEKNVPLNIVSRWLGHANLQTTAIYGQFTGKEERGLAARMWAV
ncbi:MAG: hypothetical protein ABL982_20910 [Vicinamibacterales bacterium]